MNLGPVELLIILGIVLLLFGARRLPELARSLGKSSREFKKGLQDAEDPKDDPKDSKAKAPATQPEERSES
jgi:sec-independent protein translocase protein TatA